MMNYPPLNDLQAKAGQLQDDPEKLDDRKPVSVAVDELYNDKLEIITPEEYSK